MTVFIYALGKVVAYGAVCYVGVRWFRPGVQRPLVAAVGLGLLRFAIGLFFALLIYVASTNLYGHLAGVEARSVLTYAAVYVPVRWVEWSLMSLLLVSDSRSVLGFALGAGVRDRVWRASGIATS